MNCFDGVWKYPIVSYIPFTKYGSMTLKAFSWMQHGINEQAPYAGQGYAKYIAQQPHATLLQVMPIFMGKI